MSAGLPKDEGKGSELKNYALEGALGEERREKHKLDAKFQIESEAHQRLKKEFQEKEIEFMKMEARKEAWTKELEKIKEENKDFQQKNASYQVEIEELMKQIDVMEAKMNEYEIEKLNLRAEVQDKVRLLKERREFFEKNAESRALSQMRLDLERDKEMYLQEIEALKAQNDVKDKRVKEVLDELNQYKSGYRQKVSNDDEVRKLKQEIMNP